MHELVNTFSEQLTEALSIGKKTKLLFNKNNFKQVVVSGLGGSGIGATIVQEYVSDKITIPFIVNKDYHIPLFVSADTLFIACSYSGNTEETLQAMYTAAKKKAVIVCISSGGTMLDYAKKNKLNYIQIPSNMPPRACLGYSLVQQLVVLKKAGILKTNFETSITKAIELLIHDKKNIQKLAKNITQKIFNKLPIIYTNAGNEGVAIRLRQQLNENSKILCWHHVLPEMTHNEIVGWKDKHTEKVVLLLSHSTDYERTKARMDFLRSVVKKYTSVISIPSKGESYWERTFYLIHLGDWISVYLADARAQNADEVAVIMNLKATMAKK